jgi:uncharacterized repeat protein (TIGR01451 family)
VITYTLNWANTLQTAATAARIEDVIPSGASYVPGSAEVTGGSFDGTKVTWSLGDVAPGARGSVSFQVQPQ